CRMAASLPDFAAVHPNTRAVVSAAADLGLTVSVRHFPAGTRSASDAAEAIGVGVERIVKSLVFAVGDDVVIALVSGANRLAEAKLARALGVSRRAVVRADARLVRSATGFPIG